MYLYICLCFLCIVICMHSFHSAHIFKLYSHFVCSPLNSYVYIHWILDFKYILLLYTQRVGIGVDTMMTLDAAKWNGTGGELSSCVINTSIRS